MGNNHTHSKMHPEAPTFEDVCPDKMNSLTKSSFKSTSKLLGEGGFSKVKLGVHRESEKKVAIKITSDKDKNARNEVRLLSLLGTHDHLCHLLECYRSGKKLYMVFDYYAQGDLMDLLLEVERFQEPVARRVAVQMADAVNFCHAFNIAHRDIKGENVFYRGDVKENNLHIVLGDFGAATYFEKWSDVFSEKIGSSCYVAPELLKGYYYPSKADVWSFGATIFALMSGHPPFHGPYRDLTTERVLTIKLELPIAITKFSSKAAQNFIMTCMTRYAWKRPMMEELIKHPWLSMADDEQGPDSGPEMKVPEPEDPALIPEELIMKNPTIHSDTPHKRRGSEGGRGSNNRSAAGTDILASGSDISEGGGGSGDGGDVGGVAFIDGPEGFGMGSGDLEDEDEDEDQVDADADADADANVDDVGNIDDEDDEDDGVVGFAAGDLADGFGGENDEDEETAGFSPEPLSAGEADL